MEKSCDEVAWGPSGLSGLVISLISLLITLGKVLHSYIKYREKKLNGLDTERLKARLELVEHMSQNLLSSIEVVSDRSTQLEARQFGLELTTRIAKN